MRLRWLTLLYLLCCPLACRRTEDEVQTRVEGLVAAAPAQAAPSAGVDHDTVAVERYPAGSWRQRPMAELNDIVLWVSHILIRYQEVQEARVSFTVTEWSTTVAPVTRSREQALTLAQQIAAEAQLSGAFERLARERSEDPVTCERAGSLGGVTMPQFLPWPRVLDALEALRPGEVSRPIETEFGYHLFMRRAPPAEQQVSAARIVLAHDQAPWIKVVGRRVPRRTRDAARILASQIQREAQNSPEAFARLAAEHSDHGDAARGGDFGTWSTHEPSPFGREIEVLSELRIGEVSAPVETALGFQVLLRTPNRRRREYAMERLMLRFDASLPEGTPGSKSVVRARAEQLAASLQDDPRPFDSLRREHCCPEPTRVIEARESLALEQALAQLRPGQIAKQPLEYASVFYVVPRRIELAHLPPQRVTRFDLLRSE
jgi:hypothetical protein